MWKVAGLLAVFCAVAYSASINPKVSESVDKDTKVATDTKVSEQLVGGIDEIAEEKSIQGKGLSHLTLHQPIYVQGAQGIRGNPGKDGAPGPQGERGPEGHRGIEGIQGETSRAAITQIVTGFLVAFGAIPPPPAPGK